MRYFFLAVLLSFNTAFGDEASSEVSPKVPDGSAKSEFNQKYEGDSWAISAGHPGMAPESPFSTDLSPSRQSNIGIEFQIPLKWNASYVDPDHGPLVPLTPR